MYNNNHFKLYYYSGDTLKNSATPKHPTTNGIVRRPAMQSHGRLDKILLRLLRDMNLKIPMDLFKKANLNHTIHHTINKKDQHLFHIFCRINNEFFYP